MADEKSTRKRAFQKAIIETLEDRKLMAFGLTTTSTLYTVDTGAGVVFSILRGGTTSSTIHLGDMTSFKLNGVEFAAPYSQVSRYSHFESGLSSALTMSATVDPAGNWIKITCDDTSADTADGKTGVIQYYIAKKNDPNIYMATYAPEMRVSSTRYIAYLDGTKFTNRPQESDNNGATGAIESSDVNGNADGTTSSKYYGETRNIDHLYHGATGSAYGAYMFIGNRERGSGGPFWKDIDWQSGSGVEIYNMPYSGHSLTDFFRPGLHGPYAMNLTNGTPPTTLPDYSFIDGVGLTGWISPSARGTISGRISGIATGHVSTVALSSTEAQFWDAPDAMGNYSIENVIPGTYTETLYDEELAVGTRTVTITAGQTTRADIAATAIYGLNNTNVFSSYNANATPIWRIGTWDGTPREFLNGDKITIMHPQDSRLSPWATDSTGFTNFTIGSSLTSEWPMAEWKTQVGSAPFVDTKNRITFTLNSTQRAQGLTLRIGVTRTDSERPGVSANGGTTQFGSIVSQPAARGVSLGNWRGNNAVYSYSFSANSLNVGTNTFDLYAIAGSTFTGYFAGYHIYDAIDLIPTSSASVPATTSITVSPGTNTNITTGATRNFFATAKDSGNNVLASNVTWTATRGTINDAGEYIAPATTGTDTITATYGSVSSSVTINVVTTAPIIATPATASPNPTYNNTTVLSVLGGDDNGEAALTYTWSTVGTQPGTVTFGATNGTNAAKSISATFSAYGNYTLQATITDASGNTTVSQVVVSAKNEKLLLKFDRHNGSGLTDYSGNNLFGSAFGDFSVENGVNSGALKFTNGGATLPSGIVAGLTNFTVAAWVKPDVANTWARIFDFGTGTNSYMYLTARSSATGNPIQFSITNSGIAGEQKVSGSSLTTGVWAHVAITLSGNTATLYVNGVAVGTNSSMTLTPSSLGSTNLNFIGESQYSADPGFQGSIDEFRIYGRALSGAEISSLADRPTVATAAAATPSPVTGTTAALSVLGADALFGEAGLTYTWSPVGTYPGNISFSANGTNAAKNSTVTFTAAGSYTFLVTIANANGNSITSTVSVTVNQTVTTIAVSPTTATLASGATQQFTATANDQFGDILTTQPTFTWSRTNVGTIDLTGLYTATAAGTSVVSATVGSVSGTATVTATNAAPTVATAAAATPNPVTGTTVALSALGADTDGGGEPSLIYTWALTGIPPAAVTYSDNATNTAKNTTATFTKAGAYTFRVTITDIGGLTVTSSVVVTVNQTFSSIVVSPATVTLGSLATQQFSASAKDQFGNSLTSQPSFTWSKTSGVGSINATGLYTASAASGSAVITATSGVISGNASITVNDAAPTVATIASASPNPVTGTTTTLSVLGADSDGGGESNLTYTWSLTGTPPASVSYSVNGTNAAKSTTATFTASGTYSFLVTITDLGGATVTSSVSVVVNTTGSIAGQVYEDRNSNGALDSGEPTLNGVTVYIDANNNSILDSGESTAVTSGFGSYAFANLPAGNYNIRHVLPNNYVPITAPTTVALSAGSNVTGKNFGDFPTVFTGTSGNDNYSLRVNGSNYDIWVNGVLTYSVPQSAIPGLTFNGGSGSDTFNIQGNSTADAFTAPSNSVIARNLKNFTRNSFETLQLVNGNYSVMSDLGTVALQVSNAVATFSDTQTLNSMSLTSGASVVSSSSNAAAPAMKIGAVTIDNSSLTVAANGNLSGVSEFGSLSFVGNGKMELHDNDLVINYGASATPYAQLLQKLKDGLTILGGAGSSGIGSTEVDTQSVQSAMLAMVDDGDANIAGAITGTSGFNLTSPTTSVVIKFTWFGDANFDGAVDGSDYALLDSGFTSGGVLTGWVFGDFDYSGQVDGSDYALIDTGFISQDRIL